jgi:signal transduction histidine kinase
LRKRAAVALSIRGGAVFESPSDSLGASVEGPGSPTETQLRLMREAILHSAHHMAVYDTDERLVAWSLNYEAFHKPVFDALRAEGRLAEVRFPEFVERSLARQFGPEALPEQVAQRVAAHRAADSAPRERFIPGLGWYHITKMPIPSGGVMTVGVDITDLKEKEAELEAARRAAEASMTAKSAFLANMSHEFRTPLNGVLGIAALLEATPLDARQTELLKVLSQSAKALLTLVDDVLDLSTIEACGVDLRKAPFRPARLLAEVVALLGPSAGPTGIALSAEADDGAERWVLGDPIRFRQVLWNLIGNALKFTSEGHVRVQLSATPEGGRVRLDGVVEDTGPGVPLDQRDAVFERFQQAGGPDSARPPGAGLGLAICRSIVEAMDGAIRIEDAPGGGALFRFHVRLDPAPGLDDGAAGA